MIFSFTRTRHEVSCQGAIFTFCCAVYGGVLACMSCRFCITPLLLQMSLTFSPYIMGGLEWRGQKLENNFTLVLNLKSDWKRNLLFRSSSCAPTLSQVKKKTNHFEAFYTMDWGHENPLKIYFTAVYLNYPNNGHKLFFLKRLKRIFSQAFCRPDQCCSFNPVMFEHKSV